MQPDTETNPEVPSVPGLFSISISIYLHISQLKYIITDTILVHYLKYKQANKIHIKIINIISKECIYHCTRYFKTHDGTYIKASLYSCRTQNNWWL